MELAEAYSLIEIFMETAARRREERRAIEQQVWLDDKKHEKHVREKEEREQLEALVLASVEQISMFNDRLNTYDTATVHALMDNGAALDHVRHSRETLEKSAYRLPDGQIAIKSDDGKRVLDRHGIELSPGTIDPGAIPDALPRWDAFKALADSEQKLTRERQDLLLFQERLDASRDTVRKGHVTADALSDMDDALRRSMPDAVKANLPDAKAVHDSPAAPSAAASGAYRPAQGALPSINGP